MQESNSTGSRLPTGEGFATGLRQQFQAAANRTMLDPAVLRDLARLRDYVVTETRRISTRTTNGKPHGTYDPDAAARMAFLGLASSPVGEAREFLRTWATLDRVFTAHQRWLFRRLLHYFPPGPPGGDGDNDEWNRGDDITVVEGQKRKRHENENENSEDDVLLYTSVLEDIWEAALWERNKPESHPVSCFFAAVEDERGVGDDEDEWMILSNANAKAEARPPTHGQDDSEEDRGVEAPVERQRTDAEFEPVLDAQPEEALPGIPQGDEHHLWTPREPPTPPKPSAPREERGQPATSGGRHSNDEITDCGMPRELAYTPLPEYQEETEDFHERAENFEGVDNLDDLPVSPTNGEMGGFDFLRGNVREFYEDSDSDSPEDETYLERDWFSHNNVP